MENPALIPVWSGGIRIAMAIHFCIKIFLRLNIRSCEVEGIIVSWFV